MKKPTMNDVARLAGVSQATVSFVLNESNQTISDDVRLRVYKAIDELNFVPRAKLMNYNKPSDMVVGLLVPNLSNPFYPDIIRCVDKYALAKGYKLILVNTNRDERFETYYLNMLINMKVAGIIFAFTPSISRAMKIKLQNTPMVIIGEANGDWNGDVVNLNSIRAGSILAEHLLSLGHKDIALITGPTESVSLSRRKRLDGMKETLNGKAELQTYIVETEKETHEHNFEFNTGYIMTCKIIKHSDKLPTAIVGMNDMTAFGIMHALKEHNMRVPEQISVCGFDNVLCNQLVDSELTTIDHCIDQRSRLAIDLLHDKITGNSALPMIINYEPVLVVRSSTGSVV